MPTLTVFTNVPKDKIPEDFLTTTTDLLFKILGKPKQYNCVHIIPDQIMSFGGTTEACASVTLACIGKLGLEDNKGHTKAVMEHLQSTLGIKPARMYITFVDVAAQNAGHNMTTFAT
ncbi:macrophage migration inhibitory factor-like [Glandiceps talaboti]